MIRSGILTFQNANNHGALLQAYALQEVLQSGGDFAEIINYASPTMKSSEIHDEIFDSFRDNYLHLSKPVKSEEIKDLNYDRIVIGSDQVWNPNITGEDDTFFLANLIGTETRIMSYAASMGLQNAEIIKQGDFYRNNLRKYPRISIREEGNIEALRQVLNDIPGGYAGTITSHIDPTLLLERERYEDLIKDTPENRYEYIFYFSYNADPRLLDFVNLCSAHTGLPVMASTSFGPTKFMSNAILRDRLTTLEWLRAIHDATLVITDSFHGLMLSMIFQKAFYAYTVDSPGVVRLMDALNRYGLASERITAINSLNDISFNPDYTQMMETLVKERATALKYLFDQITD